jgi:hypothetical protein
MRFSAAVVLALFAGNAAHADPAQDALAAVAKCADIVDSAERLKCFDAAAALAKNALAAPPQRAEESRSLLDWFGFSRPPKPVLKPEDFGKPPPEPGPGEITEIAATVVEFAKTPRGRSIFFLDNGQVWRQSEGDLIDVRAPSPGTPMKVRIETGVLGSYNLMVEGRNGLIKVQRLK